MKNYTLLIALAVISKLAHSETTIECKSIKKGENILITLDAKKFQSTSLNCIETKKDLGEGEICAPENGWGLQYPTGTAKISQIVFRWQEYMDHHGSIIGNKTTKTEMKFTSGRNESPEKGYVQDWSLSLNRISGLAKLVIGDIDINSKNNKIEEFKCGKVSAKF
jgi:hypothetical protein